MSTSFWRMERRTRVDQSISIARNNWGWAASSPALYQSINCWGSSLLPWCHTRRNIDHPHQSIHLLIDYPDPDPCWTRVRDCCRTVTLQSFFHALGGFFRFWKGSISLCAEYCFSQHNPALRLVSSVPLATSTLLTRPYGIGRTLDPPAQTTNWTLRIRIPAQQQSSIISSEQRIESPHTAVAAARGGTAWE